MNTPEQIKAAEEKATAYIREANRNFHYPTSDCTPDEAATAEGKTGFYEGYLAGLASRPSGMRETLLKEIELSKGQPGANEMFNAGWIAALTHVVVNRLSEETGWIPVTPETCSQLPKQTASAYMGNLSIAVLCKNEYDVYFVSRWCYDLNMFTGQQYTPTHYRLID